MENAADGLKIGFAVMVFVIALSIIFMMISQTKETADTILYYADDTYYQEHMNAADDNRIVGISEVIATVYRYNKESVAVTVVLGNAPGDTYVFDIGRETIMQSVRDNPEHLNITKVNTKKLQEENLTAFINGVMLNLPQNATFEEEFVEIPISGEYIYRRRWYRNYTSFWG